MALTHRRRAMPQGTSPWDGRVQETWWGRWVARAARGRRVITAFSTEPPGPPPNLFFRPTPREVTGVVVTRFDGAPSSTPQRRPCCQAVGRRDDLHRRASVQ